MVGAAAWTRARVTGRQPLGEGGQRLHDWLGDASEDVRQGTPATTGAIVAGRRTYDLVDGWGGSHPVGAPVFVLTHRLPEQVPAGATPFTFVTDGVESALARPGRSRATRMSMSWAARTRRSSTCGPDCWTRW
jgi:dihydrofolate reductase